MKLDDVGMRAQPLHGLDFPQVVGLLQAGREHFFGNNANGCRGALQPRTTVASLQQG